MSRRKDMNVGFFGVDGQEGFCNPKAPLFVQGSEADVDNVCDILDANPDTTIFSLDVHPANHISFHTMWLKNGNPVDPFTFVTAKEVEEGTIAYAGADTKDKAFEYLTKLEALGKQLMVFFPHCIAGHWESSFHPKLREAINRWETRNSKSAIYVYKGLDPHNEQFSALAPEVTLGDYVYNSDMTRIRSIANEAAIDVIDDCEVMLYGLEAGSHCTGLTINDALKAQFVKPSIIPGTPDYLNITDIDNKNVSCPKAAVWITDAISPVVGCQSMQETHEVNASMNGATFNTTEEVITFLNS